MQNKKKYFGRPGAAVVILAVIALLASAVAGIAAAGGAGDGSETGRPVAANDVPPPKAQIQSLSEGHKRIGVLRRERHAGDVPPAPLRDAIDGGLLGENADLARKGADAAGRDYYVVPAADDRVCLLGPAGGGCSPSQQVATEGIVGNEACVPGRPDQFVVAGLLPDAASRPTILYADGNREAVGARDNAFAVLASRTEPLPVAILWTDAGEPRRKDLDGMGRTAAVKCASGPSELDRVGP